MIRLMAAMATTAFKILNWESMLVCPTTWSPVTIFPLAVGWMVVLEETLWLFQHHGCINVANAVAFIGQQLHHIFQQNFTVDAFEIGRGIGKVQADVAQIGRTQQCIANGVDQHIRIGVPISAFFSRNLDTAQPEWMALAEGMDVIAEANPYVHSTRYR